MREQFLAVVARRISRGDPVQTRTAEAEQEVDMLVGFLPVAGGVDAHVASVLGFFHILRGNGPERDEQDLVRATMLLTPTYLTQPGALFDGVKDWIAEVDPVSRMGGDRDLALAITSAGIASMAADRFFRQREPGNCTATVGLFLRAIEGIPAEHPMRDPVLAQLADAVLIAGSEGVAAAVGAPAALLDEAVEVCRAGVGGAPAEWIDRARLLGGLAAVLRVTGESTNDPALLVEAAATLKAAAEADSAENRRIVHLAEEHIAAIRQLPMPDHLRAEVGLAELDVLLANPRLTHDQREGVTALRTSLSESLVHWHGVVNRTPADFFAEAMSRIGIPDDSPARREVRALLAGAFGVDLGVDLEDSRVTDMMAARPRDVEHLRDIGDVAFRLIRKIAGMAGTAGSGQTGERERAPTPYDDRSDLDEILGVVERALAELPPDTDEYVQVQYVELLLSVDRIPNERNAQSVATLKDLMQKLGPVLQEVLTQFSGRFSTRDHVESWAALGTTRSSPFGTLGAMDDAIAGYRRQLEESPDDDPGRTVVLTYLAHALFSRYLLTSQDAAFDEAVRIARLTLPPDAPPDPELVFVWGLAAHLRPSGTAMGEASGVCGDAGIASTSLSVLKILDEDARGALVAFESMKASMLSSAFGVRSEVDALRAVSPELAERFRELRRRSYSASVLIRGPGTREREEALTREWNADLAEIRTLPGFDRFLLPESLRFEDLAHAADEGPVIAIATSTVGCYALVLRAGEVEVVPLPDVPAAQLPDLAAVFQTAVAVLSGSADDGMTLGEARVVVRDTLTWLWVAVAEPIFEHLRIGDHTGNGGPWPRVWWVPTGALTVLPLHAAGRHDVPGASVIDRAISSYTPTIRALLRSRSARRAEKPSALAVAIPETPGLPELPATVREARAFVENFAGPPPLIGAQATRAAVTAALPTATLAHFACHASSNPMAPWTSHLLLDDGPLGVAEISDLELDGAELAYLSACSTASGSSVLADEAIHVSSAFQLAGYAQAIGTLWVIRDKTAARTATEFHHELSADPSHRSGAAAMHSVVRRLRDDEGIEPWEWAAYVHSGA